MADLTRQAFLNQKRDYSDYLVHLTRRRTDATAFEVLLEILRSGGLVSKTVNCLFNGHLATIGDPSVTSRFETVCFSECPLEFISDLIQSVQGRRVQLEPYGVCVSKKSVIDERGNPVLYVNWPARDKLLRIWDTFAASEDWWILADVMAFVSQISDDYDFHWEREWRIPNRYSLRERSGLIILCPEQELPGLRKHITADEKLSRWYDGVPLIDPSWRPARIIEEMSRR